MEPAYTYLKNYCTSVLLCNTDLGNLILPFLFL